MPEIDQRILTALSDLCNAAVPVTLMSRDLLAACRGRFHSIDEGGLTLEFLELPDGSGFDPPSLCIVTFPWAHQAGVFTTRIKRNVVGNPDAAPRIVVEVPQSLRRSESRLAFRVPVEPQSGLEVQVALEDGAAFAASAVNISMCGILVALPEGSPELQYNQRIGVSLTLGRESITLRGAVRRREGVSYGLFFPELFHDGELTPPETLRNIMSILEFYWRRNQGEGAGEPTEGEPTQG